MNGFLKDLKLLAVLACIFAIPLAAAAQDLGSTSGLFKTKSSTKKAPKKKSSSKKSTPKKSTSRSKPSSKSRTASSSRKNTPRKSTTGNKTATSASKEKSFTASKTVSEKGETATADGSKTQLAKNRPRKSNKDIVITVGEKTTGNYSELFEDAIADGNAARNRRLYVDAENAYGRAITIDPEDSRAVYGLGNLYSDQQRWEEAEAAYRKALAIEPDSPMANIALSYVLTQPVVGSNLGERYLEADKVARKAIELDPGSAIGYDQLGVAMELRGIISQETEDAYRKAVSLDLTFALAHAHLGRLLRKQGRTNESSAAYREAINLAADVPTMILVADVMQSQQRYLDSEQLLRAALRRDPRNPTGLYLLGRALTTRRSFDEAESVIKKSVEVSPKSFVSYALLGSLYSQSGDFNRAEATLALALKVVSENEKRRLAQEFEEVGDGLVEAKKYSDAARLYRRAIALDSEKEALAAKLAAAQATN